jgi:hypothetical protein
MYKKKIKGMKNANTQKYRVKYVFSMNVQYIEDII